MAYEIFSIKMYELDKKIGRLQSRIRLSESADHDRIRTEAAELRRECEEDKEELVSRLRHSKSGKVAVLSEAYGEMEQTIRKATDKLEGQERKDENLSADEKILFAEYALDFAMQAVNHALLVSMEALDTYMTQQEERQ